MNDDSRSFSQRQQNDNLNQSNSTPLEYDVLFNVQDTFTNAKLGFLCIGQNKYSCVSGKYGLGALPKGQYKINKCYKLKPVKGKTEPYTGLEFPWVAKLTPQFQTNRSKLLIHPDGGVEGTRGCIGIRNKDVQAFEEISLLLKTKKELILCVNK